MEKGISIQTVKEFCEFKNKLSQVERKQIIYENMDSIFGLSRKAGCFDQELLESLFFEKMSYVKSNLSNMKKSIIFKVTLQGCEDNVVRIIELPYQITLADVAYTILASVRAYNRESFLMNINDKTFGSCHQDGIDDYASHLWLSELSFQIYDRFTLIYDLKEQYIFDIEVIDIKEHQNIQSYKEDCIHYQKGIGIWENAHDLLKTYYDHYDKFIEIMEQDGLDEQDYFIEIQDLKKIQYSQIEDYRMTYELN